MNQAAHISAPPIWESPDRRGFIRIEKISKAFGDFVAVDDVRIDIGRGELFLFWAVPVAVKPRCCESNGHMVQVTAPTVTPYNNTPSLGRTSVFVLAPKRRGCAYPLAVRSPGAWAQTHWRGILIVAPFAWLLLFF